MEGLKPALKLGRIAVIDMGRPQLDEAVLSLRWEWEVQARTCGEAATSA